MSRIVSLSCVAVVMIGFGARPAVAQQAPTAGPISLGEVFTGPDSANPIPAKVQELKDVIQRSPNPGQCPKGKVTVVVKKGDELFQQALAAARRLPFALLDQVIE